MSNAPEFLRREQLAGDLGISTQHLQRMRERGELPRPVQISERVIGWRRSVIEKWLAEREAVAR